MKLSDFILTNIEPVLQAWEAFARTVDTPMPAMDSKGLRNHAEYILRAVALDMRTHQTALEEVVKSHGLGPVYQQESAAETHALTRLVAGFTMDQMVSEYRALRSSVLRLWLAQQYVGQGDQVNEVVRFNEAIDQALVESIRAYGKAVETTRKTVLAVLGHDLRTPLGAVMLGLDLLAQTEGLGSRGRKLISQISTSVRNALQMVNDLLDLARCNLGTGIPVQLQYADLMLVCQQAVDELSLAHPQARIVFTSTGSVTGQFDPARMAQVFSNLIGNAVRHGDTQYPVNVALELAGNHAQFTVQNRGEPIPAGALSTLFDPEARCSRYSDDRRVASSGLGLGLFIAGRIIEGHGGKIAVESTLAHGTVFRVTVPLGR